MLNDPEAAGGGGGGGLGGGQAQGGAGGQGGGAPGESGYIQVTTEEKQAIERVCTISVVSYVFIEQLLRVATHS